MPSCVWLYLDTWCLLVSLAMFCTGLGSVEPLQARIPSLLSLKPSLGLINYNTGIRTVSMGVSQPNWAFPAMLWRLPMSPLHWILFIFYVTKKPKPRENHEQVQSLGFVDAEDSGATRALEPSTIQQTGHFSGEKTEIHRGGSGQCSLVGDSQVAPASKCLSPHIPLSFINWPHDLLAAQ